MQKYLFILSFLCVWAGVQLSYSMELSYGHELTKKQFDALPVETMTASVCSNTITDKDWDIVTELDKKYVQTLVQNAINNVPNKMLPIKDQNALNNQKVHCEIYGNCKGDAQGKKIIVQGSLHDSTDSFMNKMGLFVFNVIKGNVIKDDKLDCVNMKQIGSYWRFTDVYWYPTTSIVLVMSVSEYSDDRVMQYWNIDTGKCEYTSRLNRYFIGDIVFRKDGMVAGILGEDSCNLYKVPESISIKHKSVQAKYFLLLWKCIDNIKTRYEINIPKELTCLIAQYRFA